MAEGLLCNAGANTANIQPDGTVTVCRDRKDEVLGNIFTGFNFRDELVDCTLDVCQCPLWSFDKNLHAKAKGEPHEKITHDAFLHWYVTYSCNFLCDYCIVDGTREEDRIEKLKPGRPIDIDGALRTIEATGKTFSISFMGGEPFVVPNLIDLCAELTKKHFVSFNSNIITLNLRLFEVCNLDNLGVMHISFHISELEKRNLVDRFIKKILGMKERGYNDFFITCVADPTVFAKLPYYRNLFEEHGLQFKLIPMIEGGGLYGKPYPESYTENELQFMKRNWLDDYFPLEQAAKANAGETGFLSSSCKTVYDRDDS